MVWIHYVSLKMSVEGEMAGAPHCGMWYGPGGDLQVVRDLRRLRMSTSMTSEEQRKLQNGV